MPEIEGAGIRAPAAGVLLDVGVGAGAGEGSGVGSGVGSGGGGGGVTYVKALAREPGMTHDIDTVTLPAVAAGGVVARNSVDDTGCTFVAATPPNHTAEQPKKYVPVMVTTVPPAVLPDDGLTVLMTGVMPPNAVEAVSATAAAPPRAAARETGRGEMGGSGSKGDAHAGVCGAARCYPPPRGPAAYPFVPLAALVPCCGFSRMGGATFLPSRRMALSPSDSFSRSSVLPMSSPASSVMRSRRYRMV